MSENSPESSQPLPKTPEQIDAEVARIMGENPVTATMYEAFGETGAITQDLDTPDLAEKRFDPPTVEELVARLDGDTDADASVDSESDTLWEELDNLDGNV